MLCDVCGGDAWIVPLGAAPPKVDFYEAFDPDKATEKDRVLFEGLTGEVLYIDPYMGPATLDRLSFFRNADLVRFLKDIHDWPNGDPTRDLIYDLETWAAWCGVEAVIWTGLPPKFKDKKRCTPTIEQVLEHLNSLPCAERDCAERYIRNTPRQIDATAKSVVE